MAPGVESTLKSAKVALLVFYRMVNRILFVPLNPFVIAFYVSFSLSSCSTFIYLAFYLFSSDKQNNQYIYFYINSNMNFCTRGLFLSSNCMVFGTLILNNIFCLPEYPNFCILSSEIFEYFKYLNIDILPSNIY